MGTNKNFGEKKMGGGGRKAEELREKKRHKRKLSKRCIKNHSYWGLGQICSCV